MTRDADDASAVDIMVVDDDPLLAQVLRDGLAARGATVEILVPHDGEQLLAALRLRRPRLLVLDVMMPGLDGLSLCRLIKDDPGLGGIQIAIYTTKSFDQDRLRAEDAGADLFLMKGGDLSETIGKLLDLAAGTISVRFWGVRGSIVTPGPRTSRYGGNTPCVEVRAGGRILVFDAGSGIRELGAALLKESAKPHLSLFISHHHWDHIHGLPFFGPCYAAGSEINFHGPQETGLPLEDILSRQMESVYFPIPLRHMAADIRFRPLGEETLNLGPCRIKTIYLNHPGNTLGYRIEHGGRSVVYMTDNELEPAGDGPFVPSARFLEFCRKAGLLIHDAQYTEAEYAAKRQWGHSSVARVLELALQAEARACVLFHHDPDHPDDFLDRIQADASAFLRERGADLRCVVACERSRIRL